MARETQVLWLLSPIRSGSSITAYAAAEALRCPVADEIFGPWDRTGHPYYYPIEQRALRDLFERAGQSLTPEAAYLASDIFATLRGPNGRVICKHPHESITPEEIEHHWPGQRCAILLRNPLAALNSLFVRGWDEAAGGGSMLGYFSAIARRWLDDPGRLLYDDLQRDPRSYFDRLFRAWGLDVPARVAACAAGYKASNYHHTSKETSGADKPEAVRSEQAWRVPPEIVEEYLADPLMRRVFEEAGWSLDPGAYSGAAPVRSRA